MKNNLERIKNGFKIIWKNKILIVLPIMFFVAIYIFAFLGYILLTHLKPPFSSELFVNLFYIFVTEILIIGFLGIIIKLGTPRKAKKYETILKDIEFVDKQGNPPILLAERKLKNGSAFLFFANKIPLSDFEKKKDILSNALNVKIVSVAYEKDMQHIIVNAITKFNKPKDLIYWSDDKLSNNDFELVIGESIFGDEIIDISTTPHLLLGGGSGSGKTILQKNLLMQSIKKGAEVYIVDFKGGIDYNSDFWHKKSNIITTKNGFYDLLNSTIEIMKTRQNLLLSSKATNISEYNKKSNDKIKRIIIACDEIAEVLDKTGLNKEEKEFVSKIESHLSTLARKSRATGIHLILCTQRPSVEVLKGEIKANLGYKFCGRADDVLSRMILDNSSAAEMISPTDQGMFLTNTNVLFKGFYLNDVDIE